MRAFLCVLVATTSLVDPSLAFSVAPGPPVSALTRTRKKAGSKRQAVVVKLQKLSGVLSAKQVFQVLNGLRVRLESCYTQWPSKGDLVVNLEINAAGLNLLQISQTSVATRPLELCLLHVLSSAEFRHDRGSTEMTVRIARQPRGPVLISVDGSLDRSTAWQIIRQRPLQDAWPCLKRARDQKNNRARPVLDLLVHGNGRIDLAGILPPALASPPVISCIKSRLLNGRFSHLRGSGTMRVQAPAY